MRRVSLFRGKVDGLSRRQASITASTFGAQRLIEVRARSTDPRRGIPDPFVDLTVGQARELHALLGRAIEAAEAEGGIP